MIRSTTPAWATFAACCLTLGCQLPFPAVQSDIAWENAHASESSDDDRRFTAARELEASGQWKAAEQAYRELALLAPRQAKPLHRLAVIADRQRLYDRAHQRYERALALEPDNPKLRNDYGYSLVLAGQPQAAIEQLQIAANTGEPRAQNNLAMAFVLADQEDAAMEQFLAANSQADAHYNMAVAIQRRDGPGDHARAERHLQWALQAEPQHPLATKALETLPRDAEAPRRGEVRLVAYREGISEPVAALPNARSGASRRALHRQAQAAAREGVSRR